MRKELPKNSLMVISRKTKPLEMKILRNSKYWNSLLIKDSKNNQSKMPWHWLSFKNQPSLKKNFSKWLENAKDYGNTSGFVK